MTKKVGKQLLSLLEIDRKYFGALEQQRVLAVDREMIVEELGQRRTRLVECENALKEGTLKQVLEEHRLRDEQKRIVDRRKQLSDLSGAKVAKFMERELDIASRALQTLEDNAMKALEESTELETKLNELRASVELLQQKFEEEAPKLEKQLSEIEHEIVQLKKQRHTVLSALDDRLSRLYDRVTTRYPGSAVAYAQKGSCRSCFRALPHQTYNQVLAGNSLIQCPGCSRILVYVETEG